jgi:cell division protein FtsL
MARKEKAKKSVSVFAGIFFVAGLAVLVAIGISLGRETYRKRQIQKEIENLQSEIQKMNQENSELGNFISYLSTQEFQEKEAREKLNLQKEDERMIVLRKELEQQKDAKNTNQGPDTSFTEDESPNWQKWLKFFFGN